MISRRIIRTKVMQIIFAHFTSPDKTINAAEKELVFSMQKSYDLYHLLLLLPIELKNYALEKMELAKNKHLPSHKDLNPNTKFISNRIIEDLENCPSLKSYVKANSLTWGNYPEFIRKLYLSLEQADFFKTYMGNDEKSFEEDKKLIDLLYKEIILTNEDLDHVLEEQCIFWNDEINFVISMTQKTIKRFKEFSVDGQKLMPWFKDEDDRLFARDLLRKSLVHHTENRDLIEKHIRNWDIDRVAVVDRMILELAITEFIHFPSIPTKVTLNEYIDLSKIYSSEKSKTFINGILDKIVKELREEGKIKKVGRGLMGEE